MIKSMHRLEPDSAGVPVGLVIHLESGPSVFLDNAGAQRLCAELPRLFPELFPSAVPAVLEQTSNCACSSSYEGERVGLTDDFV